MKNNTTKIITFIGIVALSLSALFVSVGSASGGNPFGANPPGFFEPIPMMPIEQIVDVNEPTVQYHNSCIPFHEVNIMITNNSVGLDQEFSVYILPEDPETELVSPLYADNHVEVASMTSAVVSFDGAQNDNIDLKLLVYLNPMDLDNPLLDVSIDACPILILWPIPDDLGAPGDDNDDEDEPGIIIDEGNDDGAEEQAPVVVENNDDGAEEGDGVDEPVIVEDNSDKDVDEAVQMPQESQVWGNAANTNSLDTDEGDSIGVPPEPEINPENTDEAASSEAEETQESSGLSFLWIILIIVGGVTTVGITTRAIQKNNS